MEELKERLKAGIKISDSGCWEWQKALRQGYGVMNYIGKTTSTHRLSYLAYVGTIPEGLFVCHKCDNRRCINPDHLFLGTQQDNMIDCIQKGRFKRPEGKLFELGHKPINRVLSSEQVDEIRAAIEKFYPQKSLVQIAKELGLPVQKLKDMRRSKGSTYLK